MKTAASKCQHIIDDGFVELDRERCLEQCRLWPAVRVAESELLRTIVRKLDARCLENEGKLTPEIEDSMRRSLILAQFAFFMTGIGHNLHTIQNCLSNYESAIQEQDDPKSWSVLLCLLACSIRPGEAAALREGVSRRATGALESVLLARFDCLDAVELSVAYEGLRSPALSDDKGDGGARLADKMRSERGFRV